MQIIVPNGGVLAAACVVEDEIRDNDDKNDDGDGGEMLLLAASFDGALYAAGLGAGGGLTDDGRVREPVLRLRRYYDDGDGDGDYDQDISIVDNDDDDDRLGVRVVALVPVRAFGATTAAHVATRARLNDATATRCVLRCDADGALTVLKIRSLR